MMLSKFRELIIEYLDEQEIEHFENENLHLLCLKAAINDYSFSDEMIRDRDTSYFIPQESIVEWVKTLMNK